MGLGEAENGEPLPCLIAKGLSFLDPTDPVLLLVRLVGELFRGVGDCEYRGGVM